MQEWDRSPEIAAGRIDGTDLPGPPARKLAILTCMDARIDLDGLFHLDLGDAHVIRNAGGLATNDAIRSLAASQRLLDTNEILVVHHTDCGIHRVHPSDFADQIAAETGRRPDWDVSATDQPETTLQLTLERLREAEEIPHRDRIHGAVIELTSGRLIKQT